ncbi:MAG: ATP-binding protein [Euryarchaeota archaeon]|jgi:AAA+ superfamily predicted ATPase|nr:ATP-binding protein [Euryarchaeota archaeon]MBT3970887.1 ATP-binding protein [Euryarchaeota archaeon]MBT4407520.1 ATP-binding protein [Euryarchaeota archaeon]
MPKKNENSKKNNEGLNVEEFEEHFDEEAMKELEKQIDNNSTKGGKELMKSDIDQDMMAMQDTYFVTPWGKISHVEISNLLKMARKSLNGPELKYCQSQLDLNEFIGKDADIDTHTKGYTGAYGKLIIYSVGKLIEEEFELVLATRYNDKGAKLPLAKTSIKIGPNIEVDATTNGWHHAIHKESKRKFVVHIYRDFDGEYCVSCHCDSTLGKASDFIKLVDKWFAEKGPLKGAVVSADLNFLEIDVNYGMDDVVLDEKIANSLQLNVFGFLKNMESLNTLGLSTSRGVLLAGPPGTGKTSFCRAVLNNKGESTAFYVTSDDVSTVGTITEIYKHARAFAPSIVIIEDIDTLGGLDRRIGSNPLLGELLNALDGAEDNTGVITVATSNHVEHLDEALRNRPGRFDAIIEVGLPDKDALSALMLNVATSHNIKINFNVGKVAAKLSGLTGAWVKELLTHSALIALDEGAAIDKLVISEKIISVALEEVLSRANIATEPPTHSATIGATTKKSPKASSAGGFDLYN